MDIPKRYVAIGIGVTVLILLSLGVVRFESSVALPGNQPVPSSPVSKEKYDAIGKLMDEWVERGLAEDANTITLLVRDANRDVIGRGLMVRAQTGPESFLDRQTATERMDVISAELQLLDSTDPFADLIVVRFLSSSAGGLLKTCVEKEYLVPGRDDGAKQVAAMRKSNHAAETECP